MPQADFYILPHADIQSRYHFLMRLSQRALNAGHTLYIHTVSRHMAEEVSRYLWRAEADYFLPNQLAGEEQKAPIRIGWAAEEQPIQPDVLINLGEDYPAGTEQFSRIVEVVIQEPTVLNATRQRFKRYQDAGIQPNMHDLRKRR